VVTDHLRKVLKPDPAVAEPVSSLAAHYRLAVVSSSASSRVSACLSATGLDPLFADDVRFSAEDSLPRPESKPSPAVYELAAARLGVEPDRAVAVEDSVPGVQSALAAGHPVIGNLQFVPVGERSQRRAELLAAGAGVVVESWSEVAAALPGVPAVS
jgi:beta-phosphoglucomutase-like phosphatase (HAD superfamily)